MDAATKRKLFAPGKDGARCVLCGREFRRAFGKAAHAEAHARKEQAHATLHPSGTYEWWLGPREACA